MLRLVNYILLLSMIATIIFSCGQNGQPEKSEIELPFVITAKGDTFQIADPSEKMLDNYARAKTTFEADSNNVDNIIWFGRRTAYLGQYYDAIDIYSKGIEQFPEDARLYRHRGHRYISVRDFDKAILDLEKAAELIKGTENEIEPDGLPNAQNIPVSSLHGNIWYHLGLAYYLKKDYPRSFVCFMNGRNSGSNDDNIVSTTHWLYMNAIRMENDSLAENVLKPIDEYTEIIENFNYYKLCKLYKGLLPIDSLQATLAGNPSGDALKYGMATWFNYKGNSEKSMELIKEILDGNSWSSFGYIAAESDYPNPGKE